MLDILSAARRASLRRPEQAVIPLPARSLACRWCGTPVTDPTDIQHTQLGVEWVKDPTFAGNQRARTITLDLALCEACSDIDERAGEILDDFPHLVDRLGGLARERIASAIAVFAALPLPLPWPRTARDALRLITHVTSGSALSWAVEQRPGWCTSTPWAHLTSEARDSVRGEVGAYLEARVQATRPPSAHPIPTDSDRPGCGYCGIPSVTAPPSASPWSGADVDLRAIGGTSGRVWLHLCPHCAHETRRVGSFGRHSLLAAAAHAAGHRLNAHAEAVDPRALVAFAAMPPGTPPTATPFGWIDLDTLARDLKAVGA